MTLDPKLVLPAQTMTRLITSPRDIETLTGRRETDLRTALARGVAEYVAALSIDWHGGRNHRFVKVLDTWSDAEDPAEYPSAIVYTLDSGDYDASRLTPKLTLIADGAIALYDVAELSQGLTVEVWATDKEERMALVAMLEDAFDPVPWMTGFRLELPHYYNSRATFEKLTMVYEDDASSAQRRIRKAVFSIHGTAVQYRKAVKPPVQSDVRVKVEVSTDG